MRRWEELRSDFDRHDVHVVTVCTDSPKQIQKGHRQHRLGAVMLSDRDLTVTDAFGLRNLGFHSGPFGLEGLPVPTSILIGGDGKVLWVDQAENYQRRNGPEVLQAALHRYL
ncbi:MAG TPA: redoxin domain-containing protein [Myxococcales bacterium]|nr:redoxin domain-containing protein [Myxococcales bacterium]HIM00322.1 redoxin domain-containing protein [Myxococcales bacterium]